MLRTTHTYAELPVSKATFDEIAAKLKTAGYDHAFDSLSYEGVGGTIDMHGIGLTIEEPDRFECLLGSDLLPSMVTIKKGEKVSLVVQLGVVVRKAFERTGMTVKQWNAVPCSMREVMLAETVEFMATEI